MRHRSGQTDEPAAGMPPCTRSLTSEAWSAGHRRRIGRGLRDDHALRRLSDRDVNLGAVRKNRRQRMAGYVKNFAVLQTLVHARNVALDVFRVVRFRHGPNAVRQFGYGALDLVVIPANPTFPPAIAGIPH